MVRVALVFALVAAGLGCTPAARHAGRGEEPWDQAERRDVDAARALDQEGVRAFREGRYEDAIRYFRAAHRLGGPSSELWNIARSLEKMDDAAAAEDAITEYLRARDVAPADRAEAEREAQALRARPSTLTVSTTPAGALVAVDGRVLGQTPLTVEVAPGTHGIAVRHEGYARVEERVEARLGRAVLVTLDLARARN
jgi:tetratricopeptide (TPR) repeat protein